MQFTLLYLFAPLLISPLALGHGDLHMLIEASDKKVEMAPSDPLLLLERANLLRQHDQFDKSLSDLAKVAEIDPTLEDRHILIAKIEIDRENWNAAIIALNAYLRAQAKSSEGHYLRSKAEFELRNENPNTQSLTDAKLALDLQDKPPLGYHLHYIELLTRTGDSDAVERAFAGARDSLGELPSLQSVHAHWLAKTGHPEKAAEIYVELRAATPTLAFHWWVEEAAMWRSYDGAKAQAAEQQALAAWEALPEKVRARKAMIQKHEKFIESISSQKP